MKEVLEPRDHLKEHHNIEPNTLSWVRTTPPHLPQLETWRVGASVSTIPSLHMYKKNGFLLHRQGALAGGLYLRSL